MSTAAVELAKVKSPSFWGSTNGKKAVMAVTGAVMFVFVIGHLAGNLQVFEGPEKLNQYGKLLHDLGELLWPVRIVLLLCVTLHIIATVQLALVKKRARPVGYSAKKAIASSYASRTMYWSGPIVLHLTAGYVHPGSEFIEGDVYHNVVSGFQVWWVSVWYIFSVVLLGLHLRHGLWSAFQSLGMNHPRHTPILKSAAWVIAVAITLGYISIPISVLLGVVK
jgi:succinate dehydrogenase / fumarate reductase cytochrome b subunit